MAQQNGPLCPTYGGPAVLNVRYSEDEEPVVSFVVDHKHLCTEPPFTPAVRWDPKESTIILLRAGNERWFDGRLRRK